MRKKANTSAIGSQPDLDRAVWTICDILRRDKAKGARLYVPELTWMLFLSAIDQKEAQEEARARALGTPFSLSIESPYRWRDWAAPSHDPLPLFQQEGFQPGWKRRQLTEAPIGSFLEFVNGRQTAQGPVGLFPYLRALGRQPGACCQAVKMSR